MSNSVSATKSRSLTASMEFAKASSNPSARAVEGRIDRQRRTRERPGAERRHVHSFQRVHQSVDVTQERPGVRVEMVAQEDRLGALQMGVARAGTRPGVARRLAPALSTRSSTSFARCSPARRE